MKMKFPAILFFINGAVPTMEQQDEAVNYGPGVRFRNVLFFDPDRPLERVDAWAGDAPQKYREALPHAPEFLARFQEEMKKQLAAKSGKRGKSRAKGAGNDAAKEAGGAGAQEPAVVGNPDNSGKAEAPAAKGWKANA